MRARVKTGMGRKVPMAVALATMAAGCSWTTFSSYKSNDDVFALTQRSFGEKAALSTNSDSTTAFAALAGPQGAGVRFYPLGDGTGDPSGDPSNNDPVCQITSDALAVGQACVTPETLAPVGVASVGSAGIDKTGCFALGFGRFPGLVTAEPGIVLYCVDHTVGALQGLTDAAQLQAAFATGDATTTSGIHVSLAGLTPHGTSSGINVDNTSPLLFGDPLDEAAYVYLAANTGTLPLRLLHPPASGESYGASVGIGRSGAQGTIPKTTTHPAETYTPVIYGVGAPNSGKIYLYVDSEPTRTATNSYPVATGCVSDGSAGFGSVFRFGDVDGNGIDDLVVTGVANGNPVVHVYLDRHLPKTPTTTTECATTLTTSDYDLSCAEVMGAGNCATSEFGHSLAVGYLAGALEENSDSGPPPPNQVAVGAPGASAAGAAGAGVVFLYTPVTSTAVADVRYRGDATAGAGFGAGVDIAYVGAGQDTLLVSARGEGDGYVVWCNDLPNSPTGTRCRVHP